MVAHSRPNKDQAHTKDISAGAGRLRQHQCYHFSPNWALALNYRYDDYRVDVDGTDWTGEINYKFRGPQLTLRAGF